jgi:tetratricopeptide (TPR) repeat protein
VDIIHKPKVMLPSMGVVMGRKASELDMKGRSLEKKGKIEKALEAYARAVALEPDYTRVWFRMTVLYHQLGRIEEARLCAQKVLEVNPDWSSQVAEIFPHMNPGSKEPEALEPKADEYDDSGRYDPTHDIPISLDRPASDIQVRRARVQKSADKKARRLKAREEERPHGIGPVDPRRRPVKPQTVPSVPEGTESSWLGKAIIGATKTAKFFFDHVDDPGLDREELAELTEFELRAPAQRGPLETAADEFMILVQLNLQMMQLYPFYRILKAHLKTDLRSVHESKLKDIESDSSKAVKEDRQSVDDWLLMASSQMFRRNIKKTDKTLRKALKHNDTDQLWFMLGALLLGEDMIEDAFIAMDRAKSLNPEDRLIADYHGHILRRTKQYKEKRRKWGWGPGAKQSSGTE